PALSESCKNAVFEAAEIACDAGVRVALDPNYRSKLWSADEFRRVVRDLATRCDILLPGREEAELLTGESDPEIAARDLQHLGPLLAEHPPLARVAAWPAYRWLVVGTVCLGAFMGQLDASIAGLVLPTLQQVFAAPVASVEWVAIAYLLTLAALVVPLGRVADLLGRKMLYTWGFLVFIVGSALCGTALSLDWLIAFRVVQAIGAAMLQANSVAIITAAVPRRVLGRAIGVQGAAQAVGLSVGPSLGGLLIDSLGWQWVFFIAVPFGLLGTVVGWLVLPRTSRQAIAEVVQEPQRFDWIGAALLGPAVALALLGVTYRNSRGWTSPLLAFAVGLA